MFPRALFLEIIATEIAVSAVSAVLIPPESLTLVVFADPFIDGTLDSTWSQVADFSSAERMEGLSTAGIQDLATRNP